MPGFLGCSPEASLQKALEEQLAKKGDSMVESQADALKNADELSETGMNQAATIGALWCAHGANAHANDTDLAEQSFGTCKDYLGAAETLRAGRGGNKAFQVDQTSLTGDFAESTLTDFEKNFGITGAD